jgi:hypothetical protein
MKEVRIDLQFTKTQELELSVSTILWLVWARLLTEILCTVVSMFDLKRREALLVSGDLFESEPLR